MRTMTRFGLGIVLLSGLAFSAWAAGKPTGRVADVASAPACKIIKKDDWTYTCPDNSSSGRWWIGPGASVCTQQLKPTKQDEVCPQVWEPADWAGRQWPQ
jgi:hypothetical protein